MFPCSQCGECCRNLDKSPIYADLDSGNGTCKYLKGNLCSIYESRPLLCRIDDCYEQFFKDRISRSEYYQWNLSVCIKLKKHQL